MIRKFAHELLLRGSELLDPKMTEERDSSTESGGALMLDDATKFEVATEPSPELRRVLAGKAIHSIPAPMMSHEIAAEYDRRLVRSNEAKQVLQPLYDIVHDAVPYSPKQSRRKQTEKWQFNDDENAPTHKFKLEYKDNRPVSLLSTDGSLEVNVGFDDHSITTIAVKSPHVGFMGDLYPRHARAKKILGENVLIPMDQYYNTHYAKDSDEIERSSMHDTFAGDDEKTRHGINIFVDTSIQNLGARLTYCYYSSAQKQFTYDQETDTYIATFGGATRKNVILDPNYGNPLSHKAFLEILKRTAGLIPLELSE